MAGRWKCCAKWQKSVTKCCVLLSHLYEVSKTDKPIKMERLMVARVLWVGDEAGMRSSLWWVWVPWTAARQAPLSMGILQARIMQWVAVLLLQGIFLSQGLNPGLLHRRWILYHPSHQGSPRMLDWIAYPCSRESSQPRNWTRVSWPERQADSLPVELQGKPWNVQNRQIHRDGEKIKGCQSLGVDEAGMGSNF